MVLSIPNVFSLKDGPYRIYQAIYYLIVISTSCQMSLAIAILLRSMIDRILNASILHNLDVSVFSLLTLQGLSGQPLSGPDIGGFAGNATPRLFGRWMGIGAMFPFCRGHSETSTADHEPWSFGEEVFPNSYFVRHHLRGCNLHENDHFCQEDCGLNDLNLTP